MVALQRVLTEGLVQAVYPCDSCPSKVSIGEGGGEEETEEQSTKVEGRCEHANTHTMLSFGEKPCKKLELPICE